MGLYIEACDGLDKEQWLEEYGQPTDAMRWPGHAAGWYPVSLADNGSFKAALLCWSEFEVQRVYQSIHHGDKRQFKFYNVTHEHLKRNLGDATWSALLEDIKDGLE